MATPQKFSRPGPWDQESDELDWMDGRTGYHCCVLRVPGSGHLCGYVQVPQGHPLHGVGYGAQITKKQPRALFDGWFLIDDDYESVGSLFDVHGGITFDGDLTDRDGHWFGFDCAHSGDLCPKYDIGRDGIYRDIAYVKRECASLAKQLKQLKQVAA